MLLACAVASACGGSDSKASSDAFDLAASDACLQARSQVQSPGGPRGSYASGLPSDAAGVLAWAALPSDTVAGAGYLVYVVIDETADEAARVRDAIRSGLAERGEALFDPAEAITWTDERGNAAWYVFGLPRSPAVPEAVKETVRDCLRTADDEPVASTETETVAADAVPIPAGQTAHTAYPAGSTIEQDGLTIAVLGAAAVETETIIALRATNATDQPIAVLYTPPDLEAAGEPSPYALAEGISIEVPANSTEQGTIHFSPTPPEGQLKLTLHPSGGTLKATGWAWTLNPAP